MEELEFARRILAGMLRIDPASAELSGSGRKKKQGSVVILGNVNVTISGGVRVARKTRRDGRPDRSDKRT